MALAFTRDQRVIPWGPCMLQWRKLKWTELIQRKMSWLEQPLSTWPKICQCAGLDIHRKWNSNVLCSLSVLWSYELSFLSESTCTLFYTPGQFFYQARNPASAFTVNFFRKSLCTMLFVQYNMQWRVDFERSQSNTCCFNNRSYNNNELLINWMLPKHFIHASFILSIHVLFTKQVNWIAHLQGFSGKTFINLNKLANRSIVENIDPAF